MCRRNVRPVSAKRLSINRLSSKRLLSKRLVVETSVLQTTYIDDLCVPVSSVSIHVPPSPLSYQLSGPWRPRRPSYHADFALATVHSLKVKKVKVGFFYSATYTGNAATSRAVQPQEVAVDWQEPMVQERNDAATTHTTAPINHTRPSPRKNSPDVAARARKQASDYSLVLSLSTSKG